MTWLAETVMLSHGWRRFLLLVAAGAVAATSIAPWFFLPGLFLGLPIWLWALDGAEHLPGWRRLFGPAFTIGFAFGLGYFTVALHWIGAAFLQQGDIFLLLMPFAIVGLAALLSLFWGLASALAHLVWSGGALRLLALAALLAGAEWARGHLFSGFPFDLIGYALTANDQMIQLDSVIGPYGLTLLAITIGLTPALIWPADKRSLVRRLVPFFIAIALIGGQLAYGQWRLANTVLTVDTDRTYRIVQPMILDHQEFDVVDPGSVLDTLIEISTQKLKPSDPGLTGKTAVIWPESVFPFFLTRYPESLARIARMLPAGTLLLTGAPREPLDADGNPIPDNPGFNALLAIDHNGEIVSSYDKSHLVPFGEYLPFSAFWKLFGLTQFVPGNAGWAPGTGPRLMTPPGLPAFLALICYEAVFPGDIGEEEKAKFILNVTNDAWFDGSIGPDQHAHHARMRAVETGLPMIRAANSGISLVTDPLGRVVAQLPALQPGALDVALSEPLAPPPYVRLGEGPFFLAILLFGLIGAWAGWRKHGLR